MYNVREKKDKDFLSSLHNVDRNEIILLELVNNSFKPINNEWDNFINYCLNNDLSDDKNYMHIDSVIDIDNFIDYIIAQCFFANTDWPNNNVKIWKTEDSKFRFMFFDCDRGMIKKEFNQLEHITGIDQWSNESTQKDINYSLIKNSIIIRSLSKNINFSKKFASRYQDLLNTAFSTKNMFKHIDNAKSLINNEIESHIRVWRETEIYSKNEVNDEKNIKENYRRSSVISSYNHWLENISILKTFFKERPNIEFYHLQEKWNFGNLVDLEIKVSDEKYGGGVRINTIEALQYDFKGKFLSKLPINLEAIPSVGYQFDYWDGVNLKDSKIIVYSSQIVDYRIIAHFKKIE